jgi:hypothetical protein
MNIATATTNMTGIEATMRRTMKPNIDASLLDGCQSFLSPSPAEAREDRALDRTNIEADQGLSIFQK